MSPSPEESTRPDWHRAGRSYAALGVAILAVSSSALLVRWADADPIALTFWRTLAGALILAGPARRVGARPQRSHWPFLAIAGLALGLHFASWLASLELTSVAASVTLVSTAPLIITIALVALGRRPGRHAWFAVGLAMAGTIVTAAGDIATDQDALLGDALALVGAVAMAAYLLVGDRLRVELPTSVYASRVYGVAALGVLPVVVVLRVPIWGYDRRTWLAVLAMILGPQLAGHTMLNLLLKPLGSLAVSLSLLVEPAAATLLVWLFLSESPPLAVVAGAPLVIGGLALHLVHGARSSPARAQRTNRSAASAS